MTTTDDQALVDMLERVWGCIDELCSGLTEDEWHTPTDLPRWTVKDNVSHMIGTERMLLGREAPDHTPVGVTHVANEIAHRNEVEVDYRRDWPPQKVLDEFREVTGERLKELRAYSSDDFAKESFTPTGPGEVRDFLAIRIMDCWVHEQDIRRAVGKPGHLTGPVAEHAYGRLASALPYVVGKKVSPPDGTTISVEVTGDVGGRTDIAVADGRAKPADEPPAQPDAALRMDLETFTCLVCGRWKGFGALMDGKVDVAGDEVLARKVLAEINIMI